MILGSGIPGNTVDAGCQRIKIVVGGGARAIGARPYRSSRWHYRTRRTQLAGRLCFAIMICVRAAAIVARSSIAGRRFGAGWAGETSGAGIEIMVRGVTGAADTCSLVQRRKNGAR